MNVFITGGTSGMGAELARLYLKDGHRVGVCGRDQAKFQVTLKETFHDLSTEERKNLEFFIADISDRENLLITVENFLRGEKLALFIANAGIPTGAKSKVPDFNKARKMIEVTVLGTVNSLDVAFQKMHQEGGQIVTVASVAGFNGLPGVGPYAASKAAVMKLSESYGLDWKKYGIDVTCICPGFVDTPFTKINNHKMPFLMTASKAAKLMKGAIEKRKFFYVFPLRMHIVCFILSVIPRYFYRAIMSLKIFNYSS